MLVVPSAVRMFNGVHRDAPHLGPAISFNLIFVIRRPCLQQGLVNAPTPSHDTDDASGARGESLPGPRGQTDAGFAAVFAVPDDCGKGAGSASNGPPISSFLLYRADDSPLRHPPERQDVAYGQGGALAAVDELPRVDTLDSEHPFFVNSVFVSIAEGDNGEGGPASGIMLNVGNEALDVAVTLGVVQRAQLRRALSLVRVGPEDGAAALALRCREKQRKRTKSASRPKGFLVGSGGK